MAARVDELLAADWLTAGIKPAARPMTPRSCAALDLIGVVPTVGEVRAFLADSDPQKRRIG